jgi:Cysteine-rich secretory protein family
MERLNKFARPPLGFMGFRAACVLIGMVFAGLQAAASPYSHGDPSDAEQYMLELINRARTNPAQEGRFLDQVNTSYSRQARSDHPEFYTNLPSEFSVYPTAPPLAFNPMLLKTAREHSIDMLSNKYFAHDTISGLTPFDRITQAGFEYETAGENIAGMGCLTASDVLESHYGLMVDCYNIFDSAEHLGHRLNLLDPAFKEIGIGFSGDHDSGFGTQDFATRLSNPICFIVGVVYRDKNSNGQYEPGEGIPNVLVTPNIGRNTALTSASGGYAVPIEPVESKSVTKNVPLNFKSAPWSQVDPYDTAFRNDSLASAPMVTADITLSGTGLPATGTTHVSIKRPVRINYTLKGTDNFTYSLTMVTSINVKADYVIASQSMQSLSEFPAIANKTYGDVPFSIAAPASSSGLPVTVKVLSGPAKFVRGKITLTGAGTVMLAANQFGNAFYRRAVQVTVRFTVVRASQTIGTISSIADQTYPLVGSLRVKAPRSSSKLPVALTVKSGPATIVKYGAAYLLRLSGSGDVVLAANQPGNANYLQASEVTSSFHVR